MPTETEDEAQTRRLQAARDKGWTSVEVFAVGANYEAPIAHQAGIREGLEMARGLACFRCRKGDELDPGATHHLYINIPGFRDRCRAILIRAKLKELEGDDG